MIYVTIKRTPNTTQEYSPRVSLEDLILGRVSETQPVIRPHRTTSYERTTTFKIEQDDATYRKLKTKYPVIHMRQSIARLRNSYEDLLEPDMSIHYDTFNIPKRAGGYRRIDAPHAELMNALSNVKNLFEEVLYVLPHNSAHAYTKNRSTITSLKVHQAAQSKWFLKLDLKDFFPKHNLEYIMQTLETIWPFAELMQYESTGQDIEMLIRLGLLNDSLPQGTPLSPILTNILMVPLDFKIQEALRTSPQRQNFVYTRYADDLLISAPYHFNWQELQQEITNIFTEANTPFRINTEKTRYGSTSGRNWNLGIMLNRDNNLTIGHKQNQRFRAAVNNFLRDLTNGNPWSKLDVQVLVGEISYYKSIEPEYVKHVIDTYSRKYNVNLNQKIRELLQ